MPRQFNDTLVALRFGTLHDDLTKSLHELVTTCEKRGRAGSLTLKLKLKPGKGGQMEVFDEIVMTAPKEEKGSSIMFVADGSMQREDPRQLTLKGLRSVDEESGEIREVRGAV